MFKFPANFFKTTTPIALVAGGAGFIGSHICERLLKKGIRVICVDNWQTGLKENVNHLFNDRNFFLLERDVNKPIPKSIIKTDYVLHLAGLEAFLNGEDLSIETMEANSIGTRNLLEFARDQKARFLLASTTDISSAGIGLSKIEDYFGKTRREEGIFSHREAKRFAEALATEYGQKRGIDVRIVRLGDVYGPRMLLSSNSPLANLIKQVAYAGKTPLNSNAAVFPVYIDDAVDGLERTLFSAGAKLSIVSIAGPGVSMSSIGRTVQRIAGEMGIKIDLVLQDLDQVEQRVAEGGTGTQAVSWKPKVTFEEGFKKTLGWFLEKQRNPSKIRTEDFWEAIKKDEDREEKISTFRPSFPKFSFGLKGKSWGILTALFFFLWFFLSPFLSFAAGGFQLNLAKQQLLKGDPRAALAWSGRAGIWFEYSSWHFSNWAFLPVLGGEGAKLAAVSKIYRDISLLGSEGAEIFKKLEILAEGVFSDTQFSSKKISEELAVEVSRAEKRLAFIEADFESQQDLPFLTSFIGKAPDLREARQIASVFAAVLPELPALLGEEGKKKYLILFQNNAELRPTGGFIGSFAIATFEKGRMTSLDVQDVYSADGQLRGHVEPPEPIKKYLGEAGWFLRDSNWSPDFPTSAKRAAWFLDKELGEKVDGVIALDLDVAKNMLGSIGPVELADFGETVTADNLYEKAQFAAEGEFFPGSKSKKNFLTALAKVLLARFTEAPKENIAILGKTFFSGLNSRHLAVWTNNLNVNKALAKNGWGGSLGNVSCPKSVENCAADYLQIVEANVGVNKANYFLEREYSLDLSLADSSIRHTLIISYKNNSQSGVWPGGDYKNYLRVFAATGARFISASQNEERLEIETDNELGKEVGGVLVNVPAGESRKVILVWEAPIQSLGNAGELAFLWQKQMGVSEDPVWLRFSLPPGYQAQARPAPSLTEGNVLGYNTLLAKDTLFNLKWQKRY